MKNTYSKDFEYVIYEVNIVLNQFLNHLIISPTTIIEVPKLFMEHVFNSLKEYGFKNVLINPTKDELYRYKEVNTIIIRPLISKAPINKLERKITIEKLTIDIICDPLLHCFYEGAEINNMVEDIFLHYKVKYDTLRNYAKRRHLLLNELDKFLKYADNWAVTDIISPKIFKKYPDKAYKYIKKWIKSNSEYKTFQRI